MRYDTEQHDEHRQHPHTHRRHHPYERESQHSHGEHGRHSREGGHFSGHGGGHFGGPRDRARRGEARYILLDALRDGPKHGYEIIKSLEEKSGGQYAPSPGTVYPTMQMLEDQGLVRADQASERRVFHLTDAGRADLEAHADDIAAFWARFGSSEIPEANQREIGFLREEADALARTLWGGLRDSRNGGDIETIRRVRQTVERCRGEMRAIFAGCSREEML